MPGRLQIGEVRGHGLMLAIELVEDRQTKAPLNAKAVDNISLDIDLGGMIVARFLNKLNLLPPLISDESLADEMVRIVDRALDMRFSKQLRELIRSKL